MSFGTHEEMSEVLDILQHCVEMLAAGFNSDTDHEHREAIYELLQTLDPQGPAMNPIDPCVEELIIVEIIKSLDLLLKGIPGTCEDMLPREDVAAYMYQLELYPSPPELEKAEELLERGLLLRVAPPGTYLPDIVTQEETQDE